MKTEMINFQSFMRGNWKEGKPRLKEVKNVLALSSGTLALIIPKTIFASTAATTFVNVHSAIMNIFDAGVVLVIIFAGAAWGLGHRTKALEILIGVCCGYLLARHAVDIRNFLKSI